MGASSVLQAMKVPGTLRAAGVELGLIRGVQLRRTEGRALINAEEFGIAITDALWSGTIWKLGFALRGWDTDAISRIFPNVVGGQVVYPGVKQEGYPREQDAVSVVFTPKEVSHPSITFASAIPGPAEEIEVDYGHRVEHLLLCEFMALREGSGVAWGP